ncbi:MAG: potassium transporter [Deltaproteobacteria bacterium]|nr:MAG: potassium transporter [Deltaproteobacteria bacterium]
MRWRYILHTVGVLILFFGVTMAVPLVFEIVAADINLVPTFKAMLATLASGAAMMAAFRHPRTETISQREGMAIVAVGWTAIGVFGALPFYFSNGNFTFVDAFFESVSGFTTTGSSILTNIEGLSDGLLIWRSFIQWLGGMGIIVLSIAILPFLGVGGMQLYKAEVPSPVPDKLKPRIRDTAVILWQVYALFTVAEVLLLMAGDMSLFDALNHAFTTMPTGGFSTRNASVAHFDSVYIDIVITVFMLLAGVNFSLHYQLLKGRPLVLFKDAECRFYLLMCLILTAVVAVNLYGTVYADIGQALRYAAFQVVSIVTTTGFATADYEVWPAMSQAIIFFCMFAGASAGSTGGGMKCLRIMLCFKYCYKELFTMIHPRAVTRIKIGGEPVPEGVMRSVLGFLALYMALFVLATVLLAGLGVDLVTALGATAATIGNIGPGLGMVGPVDNFAQIPYLGKWLLAWCMLLGRLEIYTLIILVVPEFWRK